MVHRPPALKTEASWLSKLSPGFLEALVVIAALEMAWLGWFLLDPPLPNAGPVPGGE